jgi:hypothetical protein
MSMNLTSQRSATIRRALEHPNRGVVGLVDELLSVCAQDVLQLDWQPKRCRVRGPDGDWEELADLPLGTSVFRAILARIAVLCNEKAPSSVAPYGGRGQLTVAAFPAVVFQVMFVNTSTDQRLELTTEIEQATSNSRGAARPTAP